MICSRFVELLSAAGFLAAGAGLGAVHLGAGGALVGANLGATTAVA